MDNIDKFKLKFKQIVYQKSLITNNRGYISKLHRYDKNDSHKNAILKALDRRDKLIEKLNEMLDGKTYEEWKAKSIKLSKLLSRQKNARNYIKNYIKQKIEISNQINLLLNEEN